MRIFVPNLLTQEMEGAEEEAVAEGGTPIRASCVFVRYRVSPSWLLNACRIFMAELYMLPVMRGGLRRESSVCENWGGDRSTINSRQRLLSGSGAGGGAENAVGVGVGPNASPFAPPTPPAPA
eukprot:CAMPEP_0173293878 /NCGR_PEP_ID=MMETSP1143-20121109/13564_1 /TAXON_ID=483371 /ORGANISM="non described non described, Strain CCMP2298" /LENGTH=122 /DNA_ID=CAMNT_0014233497 /DNA_START=243 /DNA_END=608 /DNA_ORIENTATION=-